MSSGKHLEDIGHAHNVSLIYKLITSAKDGDDLSIGFDRDCGRRQDKSALNKNTEGKNQLTITLKVVFEFAERQEKSTYGLGYKLTLTGNKDAGGMDKSAAIADARV